MNILLERLKKVFLVLPFFFMGATAVHAASNVNLQGLSKVEIIKLVQGDNRFSKKISDKSWDDLCNYIASSKEDIYLNISYFLDFPPGSWKTRELRTVAHVKQKDAEKIDCKGNSKKNNPNYIIPNTGFDLSRIKDKVKIMPIDENLFFNNNKDIDKSRFVQKPTGDFDYNIRSFSGYLEGVYAKNVSPSNRARASIDNGLIIYAIQTSEFLFQSQTCGALAFKPTRSGRKVSLLEVGEYKARGTNLNGIKYMPVVAKIEGECVDARVSFNLPGVNNSKKGAKRTMPFSGTFKYYVYQNESYKWVATNY